MPSHPSVPPEGRYVVTEQGRLDAESAPTCYCRPILAGLLVACPDCGTVFGSLRDSVERNMARQEKHRWS
jgi:hypothetical protein